MNHTIMKKKPKKLQYRTLMQMTKVVIAANVNGDKKINKVGLTQI
jgi:hypothetical protein